MCSTHNPGSHSYRDAEMGQCAPLSELVTFTCDYGSSRKTNKCRVRTVHASRPAVTYVHKIRNPASAPCGLSFQDPFQKLLISSGSDMLLGTRQDLLSFTVLSIAMLLEHGERPEQLHLNFMETFFQMNEYLICFM